MRRRRLPIYPSGIDHPLIGVVYQSTQGPTLLQSHRERPRHQRQVGDRSLIDQPTTRRAYKSNNTARYRNLAHVRMNVTSPSFLL
jgi:hypothetical protein